MAANTKPKDDVRPSVSAKPDASAATDAPYVALGHDRGLYYYLGNSSRQVTALSPREHTKLNLLRLAPMMQWELAYPNKTGADWDAAADALIAKCHARGVFDPSCVRGRGAWVDGQTVVLHVGDRLLVNGEPKPLTAMNGTAIYELSLPIPAPMEHPLEAAESKRFLELCGIPTWGRKVDGYLIAGWCAIAPICGALEWRPHLWVIGSRGSGKSTIYTQIVEPVVGPLAVNPMGGSSSAGIRQVLGHDARPVLFDEAEGSTRRSSELMDEVMVLMRGASSQTKATIVKGTATGHSQDYRVRSCFGLFSIGLGVQHAADRSRITVLSLTIDRARSDAERVAHYNKLKVTIGQTLTPEWTARFRARMVRLIPTIRQSAEAWATAWAARYGDRRVGDQIGTILAGAWACASDKAITVAEADEWLRTKRWDDEQAVTDDRDEMACLQHLMQQRILMDTRVVRTVGQLVARVSGADLADTKVDPKDAEQALKIIGLYYHEDTLSLRIAAMHDGLAKLLKGTHWDRNWAMTLKRIPGAEVEGRQRFGGAPQRFVGVPVLAALGEDT